MCRCRVPFSIIKRHLLSSNNFCTLALQPPGNHPTAEFVRRPVVTKQGDENKEVVCGEKNKLDFVFASISLIGKKLINSKYRDFGMGAY